MIKLSGRAIEIKTVDDYSIGPISVTKIIDLPDTLRAKKAYLASTSELPDGFAHYLIFRTAGASLSQETKPYTLLPDEFEYLDEGDIVSISPDSGRIRVLFRAKSPHNTLLVTEQCDHYCLMCSQPPKKIDDSHLIGEIEEVLRLIPKDTRELGFTGGEPTLHGDRFLRLISIAKSQLPLTSLHVLSNGRKFSDPSFCESYARIGHHDLMIGIPIYSDDPSIHDYIVQADGAFEETTRGILNLKRYKQRVEIRVVLHKQTIPTLVSLCEFIARNLLFVDHVALMGLEMMGFTRANMDKLWIDPYDYQEQLSCAVSILRDYRIPVSVYNLPLCLVGKDVLPAYQRSISDWKNEYPPECNSCTKRALCGGFFSSALTTKYSDHLQPFKA